jgi:ubiquinol-cytochrome c reductase iron-sulfur subunit
MIMPRPSPLSRRRFVNLAPLAVVMVGAGAALWPFIDQMNPPWYERPTNIEVDLSKIDEGMDVTLSWEGVPVQIRHRTTSEIIAAQQVPLEALRDQDARLIGSGPRTSAIDANRTKAGHEAWLVVIGLCPHDHCKLPGLQSDSMRGDFGGWICPLCATHFDTSGRTRSGPSQHNLAVPPYRFLTPTRLELVPKILAQATRLP